MWEAAEHSERATLLTASLAMLGVENKQRDLVGWKSKTSDICQILQWIGGTVAKHVQQGKPNRFRILNEIDVAESADAWLRNHKTDIADSERNDITQALMRSMDSFAIQRDGNFQHGCE